MREEIRDLRIIIAGGGTGGHLFPGLAVAEEIRRRWQDAKVLFVTGRRKMETEILERSEFLRRSIDIEGVKGKGWIKGGKAVLILPWSLVQSRRIIKDFLPHMVLGLGGYSSGPVCMAAWMMGIPSAIHEQNSFPGLTNRMLCRFVRRVFLSFEESRKHFPGGTLFLTGNPIRETLFRRSNHRGMGERFTVLILGGSQGAHAVNEAFVRTLRVLKEKGRDFSVIHQTGERDYEEILLFYQKEGITGRVVPFIRDMASAYEEADIVVSRAGASTIAELAALGKPSILIPYPYAANRHQETNALVLVTSGGARMILQEDLNAEILARLLISYADDRNLLKEMGEKARTAGKPDAARRIVDRLLEMITL